MSLKHRLLGLALVAALAVPAVRAQQTAPLDIPYHRFVLDNGLTVIVHEDHKAPIVAVNIWYHVGSKNEPAGRTGFAHLFEHLMFNGSENANDDYFQALERIGATDLNGTTGFDRTNYFQNVPTGALDVALFMESDRMGHLLGAVDQAKLDEQRGVVQNEKRQGENQPYGRVFDTIFEAVWPAGHPYSHSVIGSMADLDAAKLEDVHGWFRQYYGPNNAVLVLAGDIDPATAREKAQRYFGDIPPGPPIEKFESFVVRRTGNSRMVMEDRVPQARIYRVYNVPEVFTAESDYLDLAAALLAEGKNSRLYRRLVYQDQTATDVAAFNYASEIAGNFFVMATVRPGADLAAVERALDEEMARFLADGPSADELERVRTKMRADFVRGIERIGGFGGKSDILAQSEVYGGSPDAHLASQRRMLAATPADVHRTARAWLADGAFTMEVRPFAEYAAAPSGVDRKKTPESADVPAARFPTLQRFTLGNGLKVILAERHETPIVRFSMLLDAGYAADRHASPGTASLTLDMLDEGAGSRDALAISDALDRLGASLSAGSNVDLSIVTLSALKENVAPSLDLMTDVVLRPSFPQAELDRLRQEQLASIAQEKADPMGMALRVLPPLIYGADHPYGIPFSGSGTEASVKALRRDDLVRFHQNWFRPNNATLIVVGDITAAELRPLVEARFGAWKKGDVPAKNVAATPAATRPVVYLLDKPGAPQSVVFAGLAAPAPSAESQVAIETMNTILGGAFTSRLNMNLREDKHWSYGAGSFLSGARGRRPFIAYAPVQADRTADAMREMRAELEGIVGGRPATEDELEKTRRNLRLSLPGRWETLGAVGGDLVELVHFGLPDDYYQGYGRRVTAISAADVAAAARQVVRPDALVWVVVGDRALVEGPIRQAGFADVRLIDADGRPVAAGTH